MLAMTGIAFLLLFVVFAIMNTVALYTKGVATRQMNQVGRQVTEEIAQAIRYGGTVNYADNRLCVGNRSYIWDDVYHGTTDRFTLVSVPDDGSYCADLGLLPTRLNSQPLIDGNIITLQSLTAQPPEPGTPLYFINVVVSTAGDNAPSINAFGEYECSPTQGQYCAFGEFETVVYVRKQQ